MSLYQHRKLDSCLCCSHRHLVPYLDLGSQPLANNYHSNGSTDVQSTYPLAVQLCPKCFHSQLTIAVDPKVMFDRYLYLSGTSGTLREYFQQLAGQILSAWKAPRLPRVLEIACNDGTLLKMLQSRGCEVVGVDPAFNLCEIAREKGLNVYPYYWSETLGKEWGEKFDIVIAVNVLPHVPDPSGFLRGCAASLRPGGKIYIQTSQCDMFRNGEWDAVYHEHHSYFTASSFATLTDNNGLAIVAARKVPIHSQSFLFELQPASGSDDSASFSAMLEAEETGGWHRVETYQELATVARKTAIALRDLLAHYQQRGTPVIGYGASAKFNTVANYAGIALAYLVDDNPEKWNLFTPGQNIPIYAPRCLTEEKQPLAILMTAWNFKDEIIQKSKRLRGRGTKDEMVTYIPELKREVMI
jgi:SAM-dependent methyltransferase